MLHHREVERDRLGLRHVRVGVRVRVRVWVGVRVKVGIRVRVRLRVRLRVRVRVRVRSSLACAKWSPLSLRKAEAVIFSTWCV